MKREQGQVAKRYVISGRVQGVGYRFFAEQHARELGVRGYVMNRSDGCVEVYAIGSAAALEELKRRLAKGPLSARVTGFEELEETVDTIYTRFLIEP
ncbi:MAG: acylphosphatase [Acidobacteria bacterium]|nr:MAG: acylphosphatase [Acidobacteriota bacterium]